MSKCASPSWCSECIALATLSTNLGRHWIASSLVIGKISIGKTRKFFKPKVLTPIGSWHWLCCTSNIDCVFKTKSNISAVSTMYLYSLFSWVTKIEQLEGSWQAPSPKHPDPLHRVEDRLEVLMAPWRYPSAPFPNASKWFSWCHLQHHSILKGKNLWWTQSSDNPKRCPLEIHKY